MLVLGLVLTVRASQARARLAELRSDFVSTVTHELKTPIAAIRAAGDTMARGRVTGPDALRDYAQLVVQESKRLTRLVDNLLAYARITDVTEVYTFAALDPGALLDDVLGGFRTTLRDAGFDVAVDVPPDTPAIQRRPDGLPAAVRQPRRQCHPLLTRRAVAQDSRPRRRGQPSPSTVADRGMGIPADEVAQVTRRFFRGRRAGSGGSGLGLAIASRIAADHDGSLQIESAVGAGTTVTVTLPAADAAT